MTTFINNAKPEKSDGQTIITKLRITNHLIFIFVLKSQRECYIDILTLILEPSHINVSKNS